MLASSKSLTCPGYIWPTTLNTTLFLTLCPISGQVHCLGHPGPWGQSSHAQHTPWAGWSAGHWWAQDAPLLEHPPHSGLTSSRTLTPRRPLTSTAGLGARRPLLKGPLVACGVIFQDLVVVHIERVLVDHVFVCQRDPGGSLRDDLCPTWL